MTDSRPRGPDERHPTTDRGEHVPAAPFLVHPFLCRCEACRQRQPVPWIHREATAAELAAHARLRAAQERQAMEYRLWMEVAS